MDSPLPRFCQVNIKQAAAARITPPPGTAAFPSPAVFQPEPDSESEAETHGER